MPKILFLLSVFTIISSSAFAMDPPVDDQGNANPRRIAVGMARIREEVIDYKTYSFAELKEALEKHTRAYHISLGRICAAHNAMSIIKIENEGNPLAIKQYYDDLPTIGKYYLSLQALDCLNKNVESTRKIESELNRRGAP